MRIITVSILIGFVTTLMSCGSGDSSEVLVDGVWVRDDRELILNNGEFTFTYLDTGDIVESGKYKLGNETITIDGIVVREIDFIGSDYGGPYLGPVGCAFNIVLVEATELTFGHIDLTYNCLESELRSGMLSSNMVFSLVSTL